MKISTRDMILVSFFTALTVVGAQISINLPFAPGLKNSALLKSKY